MDKKYLEKAIELLEAGDMLPAYVQDSLHPVWGHWDTHLDFRTGYDYPPAGPVINTGKFIVWIAQRAPDYCPSGPCGYSRDIETAMTAEEFRRRYRDAKSVHSIAKSYGIKILAMPFDDFKLDVIMNALANDASVIQRDRLVIYRPPSGPAEPRRIHRIAVSGDTSAAAAAIQNAVGCFAEAAPGWVDVHPDHAA